LDITVNWILLSHDIGCTGEFEITEFITWHWLYWWVWDNRTYHMTLVVLVSMR